MQIEITCNTLSNSFFVLLGSTEIKEDHKLREADRDIISYRINTPFLKDNHEMTLACLLMYKLNKQKTWFHGDFFLSYSIAYHNKNIRKINIKIYNHWKCGSTFHKYSTKYNKEKDKNEPIRLYLTSPNHHVFLTVQFFLLCERTIKL